MTNNPTIDGVSRRMLTALLCQVSEFHNRALVDELRALLDAPSNGLREHCKQCAEVVKTWPEWKRDCIGGAPAVERQEPADALSKGFYTTQSGGGNYSINIGFRTLAEMQSADKQMLDVLRSRSDVAALQSTIAQLQARVQELESGRGEYPECSGSPDSCPENEGFGCCATTSGSACPGDGVNACKKCPDAAPPAPVAEVVANWSDWSMVSVRAYGIVRTYAEVCNPRKGSPVAVLQQCKIGIYGKAYDGPETKRAYTYEDQPDNLGAHKLGQAAIAASLTRGGDLIDSGLSLLRSLHGEGFGVFEIDACLDATDALNGVKS